MATIHSSGAIFAVSFHRQITPLVIVLNEENNLSRTLAKLNWAARVVGVDSFSTDRTLETRCAAQAMIQTSRGPGGARLRQGTLRVRTTNRFARKDLDSSLAFTTRSYAIPARNMAREASA